MSPSWYQPDGDDSDLILSAVIDCGQWGRVTIIDPPESKRRHVQKVQVNAMKKLGIKKGQEFDDVAKGSEALDATAEMNAAKLAAYVTGWEGCFLDGIPGDDAYWIKALAQIPGKVADRVIAGIDLFSSAEGNAPSPSSGKSAATSSSEQMLPETEGTLFSSSTSYTGHGPGSSPEVAASTTSQAG